VESNVRFPVSTYTSQFKNRSDETEPINKERFRLKSDFTAWADASVRAHVGAPH
jgi:hypothetical protein